MEKKLAALLGKSFKTSKFKALASSAITRIAYLEKQHNIRCFQAQADIVHLLNVGQQERALLRVEHVIREQNMLDAYAMIENYFHLLMERVAILENNRKCPDELKEAISSLIFAASRCAELPEMQKIRRVFASKFGREFTTRAVELRNNSGVNPKIVKKLATRQPSLDSKLKALKEIVPANDISLQLQSKALTVSEKPDVNKKKELPKYVQGNSQDFDLKLNQDENLSETAKESKKCRDVRVAAKEAFKFAAQAAAAARAAVELSRPSISPDSQNNSIQESYVFDFDESMISQLRIDGDATSKENKKKHWNDCSDSGKLQAKGTFKTRRESTADNNLTASEETNKKAETKRSCVENDDDDDDTRRKQEEIVLTKSCESDYDGELSLRTNERLRSMKPDEVADRDLSDENKEEIEFQVSKTNLLKEADSIDGASGFGSWHGMDSAEKTISGNLHGGRRPLSMRTRRTNRQ